MASLKTDFAGDQGGLFQIALKTGLLTVLTAGIYRFWQTTRLRRWFWSSVRPGGVPLEYTGTAMEKLMGFLVAIIVLGLYLTVFNLIGMWSFAGLTEDLPAILLMLLPVAPLSLIPLIFVARYRARRYILSRTRWRGIRFGMSPGSWGYAWRACLFYPLTILSLGLLWPVQTFVMERYLTNRTWFGNARFTQSGGPGQLYGPVIPFLVCVWGFVGLAAYLGLKEAGIAPFGFEITSQFELWPIIAMVVCLFGAVLFWAYYRVAALRILTAFKTLGDGVEFDIWPRTRRLVWIYLWGNFKTSFALSFVSPIVLGLVFGVLWMFGKVTPDMVLNPPPNIAALLGVLTWLTVYIFYSVFTTIFVTYPTVRHVAETFEILEPALLDGIRQRAADGATDAGGFAEALDVGAAF